MSYRDRGFGIVIAAAITWAAPAARAELITFTFDGHVTRLEGDVSFLDGSIQEGTPFSGSYTFDSNTPDVQPWTQIGEYDNALTAFSLQLGSHLLTGSGLEDQIQIWDDVEEQGDLYYVQDASPHLLGRAVDCTMVLGDSSGTTLSSDILPLVVPPLTSFDYNTFQVGNLAFTVAGPVTSLIPEPSALVLVLTSGVALPRRRR